ncbi:hypothetical protein TNCT_319781 [Trichonephila clavata]|uniref:Uncharacterized protein n=1 Tax=Trichonephila clavata TaxID=2740835 RepID=A0A8X6H3E3_TRICU|nr:hypothetical protein TNCT_319781 [Trichonephila clavata]
MYTFAIFAQSKFFVSFEWQRLSRVIKFLQADHTLPFVSLTTRCDYGIMLANASRDVRLAMSQTSILAVSVIKQLHSYAD